MDRWSTVKKSSTGTEKCGEREAIKEREREREGGRREEQVRSAKVSSDNKLHNMKKGMTKSSTNN